MLKELKNQGISDTDASTIFDKFNTNTVGDSADVLDIDEQVGLLAFLKNIAGVDEEITKDEFYAKSSMTDDVGTDENEATVEYEVTTDSNGFMTVTIEGNGKEVKVSLEKFLAMQKD